MEKKRAKLYEDKWEFITSKYGPETLTDKRKNDYQKTITTTGKD